MINLNASEFNRKISEPDVVVLDVRTDSEFNQSHIQNSINIDVLADNFYMKVSMLDKSKSYAIYCRSGKRSLDACEVLSDLGITSLFNLSGGILDWIESGNEVNPHLK